MPQLFSRVDDLNWLTPSIADILDQGSAPPGGDGTMRQQMLMLQEELASRDTPVRIVNMRPTPSYTLFVVQPQPRQSSKKDITAADLRRSLGQIAENHKEWRLGYMPQVEDTEYAGIFLSTDQHRPLSLRRLIVRSSFRDHQSNLAAALGVTLDQRLIVRDLETMEHLIIVGERVLRSNLVASITLTQALFNTPAELRIAITGDDSLPYAALSRAPHSIGKMVSDGEKILKVIEGLAAEAQRRIDTFYEAGVNLFSAYNNLQREQNNLPIPRILLILDSLSDEALNAVRDDIIPHIRDLLLNGAQVGIHLILTFDKQDDIPEDHKRIVNTEIIFRKNAPDLADNLPNFHSSLLRFIDAFVVEQKEDRITPIEICAIKAEEVQATVEYWLGADKKRKREAEVTQSTSGRTGLTGMLGARTTSSIPATTIEERLETTESDLIEGAVPPVETPLVPAQPAMLAAYLGWLSIGALHDIFGLSDAQATDVINQLEATGVIEATTDTMYRFVRLVDNPKSEA